MDLKGAGQIIFQKAKNISAMALNYQEDEGKCLNASQLCGSNW